jgi:hypothetical protein
MPKPTWTVAGPAAAIASLSPLIESHRLLGPVCVTESLTSVAEQTDCILQIGGCAPTDVFWTMPGGRRVPIGWLPGDRDLAIFAQSAAEVARRQAEGLAPGPVVLLSQWHDRALRAADSIEALITLPKFRWTGERVLRPGLLEGLCGGPGVALYLGHAVSRGWIGYGGIDAERLGEKSGNPLGVVLSFACDTAKSDTNSRSFCEKIVLKGFCAVALGAADKVLHEQNLDLAHALCRVLGSERNLAGALCSAEIPHQSLCGYRIFGDPAASFLGHSESMGVAAKVFAPQLDFFETLIG